MKLELKEYEFQSEVKHGKVYTCELKMIPYPDERVRTIRIWLPDGYDGTRRYPVLYMHDAQNLFPSAGGRTGWNAADGMSSIPDADQAMIVGIDFNMPTRGSELQPAFPVDESTFASMGGRRPWFINEDATCDIYGQFIVNTLKPLIDENFCTLTDRVHTIIGGSSMGGLASTYLAMRYPEIFGRAVIFSPVYYVFDQKYVFDLLENYDMSKLADNRFFFYNGDEALDRALTDTALAVFRKLRERGMDSRHAAFILDTRQPHFEGSWAEYFPTALRFLLCEDNAIKLPQMPPRPQGGRPPMVGPHDTPEAKFPPRG